MNDERTYEEKILNWLEKQGHDLEMRVARAARNAGADVIPSVTYSDPKENVLRETDVVARFNGSLLPLAFVVECKRGVRQQRIAMTTPRAHNSRTPIQSHALYSLQHFSQFDYEAEEARWEGRPPFDAETPLARSIVTARDLTTKKEEENGVNIAGNAVRQCHSAAAGLLFGARREGRPGGNLDPGRRDGSLPLHGRAQG